MAVSQSLSLTQESQNSTGNSTQVRIRWTSTQTGESHNMTARTAYLYYSINGQPEHTVSIGYTLPLQSTRVVYDAVLTVPHRQDGTASLQVRTWMNTNISAGVVTKNASLTPTPIPRESGIRASDGVIGGVSRITVERKNTAYSHSIALSFGSISGWLTAAGELVETQQKLTALTINFPIPAAFYRQIPNAPDGTCRLTCTTWLGGQIIGTTAVADFTIRADAGACAPVVSGMTEDTNPVTLAVTGDSGVLIRYLSNAHVRISAQAREGASITALSVDGKPAVDGVLDMPAISAPPGYYEAADSRGFTGNTPWDGEWVPYVRLTSTPAAVRTDPTSGNVCLTFSGVCYDGSLHPHMPVPNLLSLYYSANGGDFVPVTECQTEQGRYSASVIVPNLQYDRVHSLTVRVSDSLMTVDKVLTVQKSTPVFDWGENDFRFRVPVQVDGSLTVQSLTVDGKSLLDIVYPVGTVYISLSDVEPQTLFGGTWSRLEDRFLLGAGGTYTAGSTGGEAAHTLTVSEMPSHSHTVPGRVNGSAGSGTGAWDYSGNWPVEASGNSAATGGGEAHNNMPPYLAVYMWKRTA